MIFLGYGVLTDGKRPLHYIYACPLSGNSSAALRPAAPGGPLRCRAAVNTVTHQNFGLVIAYLLPGFVALWGVSYFSPTVAGWIVASQQDAPTVAGFMYVTLASLAAGVTASAVRWAVIDNLHHATGVVPPAWKFANLEGKLQGYLALIENHYRYYQFYSNMAVAAAFSFSARCLGGGEAFRRLLWPAVGFLVLESVLLAGSRDTLRKYYTRTQQLLSSH